MTPAELAALQHEVMRHLAIPGAVLYELLALVLIAGLLASTLFARSRDR